MRGGPTYAARLYASLCSNGHPAIQAKYTYSTLLLALLFGCVVYASATESPMWADQSALLRINIVLKNNQSSIHSIAYCVSSIIIIVIYLLL